MADYRSRRFLSRALLVAAGLLAGAHAPAQDKPPVAPVRPVTDTYWGTPVVDNYRYFENIADPEVQAWMKGQAAYTRSRLDALPGRQPLLERIHALVNADTRRGGFVRRGDRYFYLSFEPGTQSPKLYYRDGVKGEERLLLDPGTMGKGTPTHYALDFFEPSFDGSLMAYGLSTGGSEESVLHVMDVKTGAVQAESIDRANGSVVSWRPDGRSFLYMRFPRPTPDMKPSETSFNARTYLHVLGAKTDGEGDPVVFGRGVNPALDVPEGQGAYVLTSPDSPWAVAFANHNLDDNPSTVYVAPLSAIKDAKTPWRKLADVADGVSQARLRGDTAYLLSRKEASRFQVLAISLSRPDLKKASVVVPQGNAVITDVAVAREGLYVRERDGAVSHLRLVSFDGKTSKTVPMPFEGNVGDPVTDPRAAGALVGVRGWLQSTRYMVYDAAHDTTEHTGLMAPASADTSGMEAREIFATSFDGTRIPVSLVYKKGLVLDGSHPTILHGYGSYGVSLEPAFDPTALAWIERGGVMATAHVRGGGEYGEDWHLAAQMQTKIVTVLDFLACAQYLIDQRYTSTPKLAAMGVSAGGIVAGGALTWRPDLFGVILDRVGMSDSLRMETEPNGPPNVSEFGSTSTPGGFHGLYSMSPYVRVRDGTPYPATFFSTGANDPRVAPWHMAKMAARTQAATSSGKPVLLRIDYDAGHGMGSSTSQREALLADEWSFALWQMGDPAFQPAAR